MQREATGILVLKIFGPCPSNGTSTYSHHIRSSVQCIEKKNEKKKH